MATPRLRNAGTSRGLRSKSASTAAPIWAPSPAGAAIASFISPPTPQGWLNQGIVLAKETGARAFFPANVHELKGVYGDIAAELEAQYSIAYAPANGRPDGQFRRIVVKDAAGTIAASIDNLADAVRDTK